MRVVDQSLHVPPLPSGDRLLSHFAAAVEGELESDEIPIRFVVTRSSASGYDCELATLRGDFVMQQHSIFDFRRRRFEDNTQFNAVMMVPTGIDCAIGGDAGDATPAARLLASLCDTLLVHPNVVNASDINELTENTFSVEGSVLCRLLMGTVGLQKVRANRVLSIVEEHDDPTITEGVINAISAARVTLGLHSAGIVRMKNPCASTIEIAPSGRASGQINDLFPLVELLRERQGEYDAVAVITVVQGGASVGDLLESYYVSERINPWGGIEAMLTHTLSLLLNIPTMHSPMMAVYDPLNYGIVDPRKAAEVISKTFTHCILKGLHRTPRILIDLSLIGKPGILSAEDIHCLIIPDGVLGLPVLAALEQGIPVISVRENTNLMQNHLQDLPFAPGKFFLVDNYLEAAGVLSALKAGVDPTAVRRPLPENRITCENRLTELIAG